MKSVESSSNEKVTAANVNRERKGRKRGRNGTGSVVQRSRNLWMGQIRLDGKRYYRYGKTEAEATRKIDEVKASARRGLPITSDTLTVSQYLERWLRSTVAPRVRPATVRSYEEIIKLHLVPTLGRIRLTKLSQQHIRELLNNKLHSGLSPRRVQMIQGTLRTALNAAMRDDLVHRNVATLVEPVQVRRRAIEPLAPADAQRLINAASDDELGRLWILILASGLRRGEALGLAWDSVDLDNRTALIHRALQRIRGRGLEFVDCKTDRSRRTVHLPEVAVKALRAQKLRQVEQRLAAGSLWQDHGLVFTTPLGTPLDPDNVTHRFQQFLERCGLPRQRLHDLRHGYATLALAGGVDVFTLQANMGHSQISMTRHYAHVLPALHRDAADRMDRLLSSVG